MLGGIPVIVLFPVIIIISIVAEILFWNYWHDFLSEQLALVTGVVGIFFLAGTSVFIYLKWHGYNHRAYDILWSTMFVVITIALITAFLTLAEILLH
jgi:hypothetical protein